MVARSVINHYDFRASGGRRVEARADVVCRIMGDDDDSDFRHVSLCPTTGEKKVQFPIRVKTVLALELIDFRFIFAQVF